MPALKAGRTYQLWIVTAKATVSAGTFEAVNGVGVMRASFTVTPENLRAIAVTEEPAGGVPQPTGETIISVTNSR
jgi:anti-sigma-K factor RskA